MYSCLVLADSIGPHGIRLTTLEVTFPRPYLAEFNTHRVFSRNSESSRAIPTELQIQRVMEQPYIPEFRERIKGMGGGEPLRGMRRTRAQTAWLAARDNAVKSAQALLTVAKDDANRLLEPFMWHTVIVSATEWENFLNLRDHPDASIPMQRIARLMREALMMHEPSPIGFGEWHLPLVGRFEGALIAAEQPSEPHGAVYGALVSAGRCARSSYSTQHDPESARESSERWERLSKAGHWSPSEHPAVCVDDRAWIGNFQGWKQLRKFYPNEAIFNV